MSGSGKVFTLAQVAEHSSSNDCWLVIGGKVYNVTKFLDEHPGGDDVLLSATGKDATEEFESVGHSTAANTMMDEFYIGDVDTAMVSTTKASHNPPKPTQAHQNRSPDFLPKVLQFLVPLLILGLAVCFRFYSRADAS